MSDPYWPWWVVILFFGSGTFCGWLVAAARRPFWYGCPNCGNTVKATQLFAHWKECV